MLLSATEVTTFALEELLEDREQIENQRVDVAVLFQAPGQGLHAEQQIFLDRHLGNDVPALGDIADTRPGPLVGRLGGELAVLVIDRARSLLQ